MSSLQTREVADLLFRLPAQLPVKDQLTPQPGFGAQEIMAAPMTEAQLLESLDDLPWEFVITKNARQEWARMDPPYRSGPHQRQ